MKSVSNISNVLFLCLYLVSIQVYSQISVSIGMSAQQYVEEVLLAGGVTVSNISYTGSSSAIGYFQTGSIPTNLGLSSGVILSTGRVNGTPDIGSNSSNHASTNNGQSGYPLLTSLIGKSTFDAAILEFDFVPLADTIMFRYIFASEEYPEYVCSHYNDVFAFFISGINPSGGNYNDYNIALIPNTTLPVAINTVNPGVPGSQGSYGGCTSLNYSQYYINNTNGQSIVFDGFTTVLTTWAKVVPCQNYRIKIAIADAVDRAYDSAVFLEAYSFTSNAVGIQLIASNPLTDVDAIVGCNNTTIEFCLPEPQSTDRIVEYTIAGTAVNGVDYETIPNSVTIPAGQICAKIDIVPIDNGTIQGKKTVELTVKTSPCFDEIVSVDILEYTPMEITTSGSTTICVGNPNPVNISVDASKGVPPYSYNWNNGLPSLPSHDVNPSQTTTYNVTVTDACGYMLTSNVTVEVTESANISIIPENPSICIDYEIELEAVGATSCVWSTGETTPIIKVSPAQTTTYSVSGTDSYGCTGTASTTVNVILEIDIDIETEPLEICIGESVTLHAKGAKHYIWSTGQEGDSIIVSPTKNTIYSVTGTDDYGCVGTANIEVAVYPLANINITPINPEICDGDTITLIANGAVTYTWSNNQCGNTCEVSPNQTTTYSLTATDQYGCTKDTTITVTVFSLPSIDFFADITSACIPANIMFTPISDMGKSFIWSFGDGTVSSEKHPLHIYNYSGNYSVSLTTTSQNNCINSIIKANYICTHPIPHADFIAMPSVTSEDNPRVSFIDKSVGATAWIWTFEDGAFVEHSDEQNPTYIYNNIGKHKVSLLVENQWNCLDTISKSVLIEPATTLYVPNAFTPNNDGINDVFKPYCYNIDEYNYSLTIYDRMGQIVFYTTDLSQGWNGTMQNNGSKIMPVGTYTYRIKASFNNIEKIYMGTIMLFY